MLPKLIKGVSDEEEQPKINPIVGKQAIDDDSECQTGQMLGCAIRLVARNIMLQSLKISEGENAIVTQRGRWRSTNN